MFTVIMVIAIFKVGFQDFDQNQLGIWYFKPFVVMGNRKSGIQDLRRKSTVFWHVSA